MIGVGAFDERARSADDQWLHVSDLGRSPLGGIRRTHTRARSAAQGPWRTDDRASRHAAALTIFAALSGLGLLGTTTQVAQVCTRTTTADTTVASCRHVTHLPSPVGSGAALTVQPVEPRRMANAAAAFAAGPSRETTPLLPRCAGALQRPPSCTSLTGPAPAGAPSADY